MYFFSCAYLGDMVRTHLTFFTYEPRTCDVIDEWKEHMEDVQLSV